MARRRRKGNYSVTLDQVAVAVYEMLDDYQKDAAEITQEAVGEVMKEMVQETKRTVPQRTGKLSRQIASKEETKSKTGRYMTWYVNGGRYRIAHLLENGHVYAGKFHGIPQYPPQHYLKEARDKAEKDLIRKLEEGLGG